MYAEIQVGRQPIYDRDRRITAYELLYRHPQGIAPADGDAATARVLINVVNEMGITKVCGNRPAFFNCTRYFLEHEPILPPEACVLEILETVAIDDALVQSVMHLSGKGYKIALDDFVYAPEWEPLLRIADFIKVDVRMYPPDQLCSVVERLRPYRAVLLAEKVESEQELEFCRALGFQLFQGYYLRHPETLKARTLPKGTFELLHLAQSLRRPDVRLDEIAQSVGRDVSLCYRLLQLVNSAAGGTRTPIRSIHHAVSIAGTDLLARWVAVLALLRLESSPGDYVEIALQRARACERIAEVERIGIPEQAYTVGLLSLLDSMLDSPWATLISSLPLSSEMSAALASREGALGSILLAVESFESGVTDPAGLPYASLPAAFWEGAAYSQETLRQLR